MDTGAIHCGSPIKTHQFILKQTQPKTRRDKLEKGMAFLHGDTKALSVKHPSIPYTDTYTICRSVALPPHCRMCLDVGLLSELLSL